MIRGDYYSTSVKCNCYTDNGEYGYDSGSVEKVVFTDASLQLSNTLFSRELACGKCNKQRVTQSSSEHYDFSTITTKLASIAQEGVTLIPTGNADGCVTLEETFADSENKPRYTFNKKFVDFVNEKDWKNIYFHQTERGKIFNLTACNPYALETLVDEFNPPSLWSRACNLGTSVYSLASETYHAVSEGITTPSANTETSDYDRPRFFDILTDTITNWDYNEG